MEENEQEYVNFNIPCFDMDSGEEFYEQYEIPRDVADYIIELQQRFQESEQVCNMIAESAKTTRILNEILVRSSGVN